MPFTWIVSQFFLSFSKKNYGQLPCNADFNHCHLVSFYHFSSFPYRSWCGYLIYRHSVHWLPWLYMLYCQQVRKQNLVVSYHTYKNVSFPGLVEVAWVSKQLSGTIVCHNLAARCPVQVFLLVWTGHQLGRRWYTCLCQNFAIWLALLKRV